MRYPIWKKDDFFKFLHQDFHIEMDAEAVVLPEDGQLAIVWNYEWDALPFGRAEDLRLEGGEITAEVAWFDDRPEYQMSDEKMEGCRLAGYYNNVTKSEDGRRVLKCDIRAVSIILECNTPMRGRDDIGLNNG